MRLGLFLLLAMPAALAQSLWPVGGAGERGMFADRKASRAGDILTVVVAEAANATNTQRKTSERQSSLEDAVQRFLFSTAASNLGTHNGELPATSITGSAARSGGGQVNNSQSLTTRSAVLVTDVLPNGNLVIEGVRVVTFSGETQYVVLHGIVRGDDITAANTVLSSDVADARVEFITEGSLTEAQKRGWLSKVYEMLRPF
jgi:flagellar L-ring protein precursor FlgH